MPYAILQRIIEQSYAPVLVLYDVLPRRRRKRIEMLLTVALGLAFMLGALAFAVGTSPAARVLPGAAHLLAASSNIYGLFLMLFAARFCFSALEAFHRSYYFRGLGEVLREGDSDTRPAASFEVAVIVHATPPDDVTSGLLLSDYGDELMMRLGIAPEEIDDFLSESTRARIATHDFVVEREEGITLPVYARSVFKRDKELERFLFARGIDKALFEGAAGWVMRKHRRGRRAERWWSRDNLGRIPGLAKEWSYGVVPTLKKFGRDIVYDPAYQLAREHLRQEEDEVEELEAVLARARQANALLVGEAGSGKREVLAMLARKIREGEALPPLEDKRIMLFDVPALIAGTKEKGTFESQLITIMEEVHKAGNIILAIENLAQVQESARQIGSNALSLMAPYLEGAQLQVVATTDPIAYHRALGSDAQVRQYFDTVMMHDVSGDALVRVLEQRAQTLERSSGTLFTYPALVAIADGGDRYFPDAVMPDKAFDLMEELVPRALARERGTIMKSDVEELIQSKTGIPTGAVPEEEQEQLMHLEEHLHERVIGQDRAVEAVAGALRRARAGVGNPDRPVGSFLFLGPTGVGKTETAKALAASFFGDEQAMHRLDMSEYRGMDALSRLIGGGIAGGSGRLSAMLREHPYTLLLLDEFEKTEPSVHDVFLQILDEGAFTDASGRPVNAHNVIIIATSNAAADLIWEYFKQGIDPSERRDEIIDAIISRGELKPELLNRFDGVIVFDPIDEDAAHRIARLQLKRLAQRLHNRGVDLVITDELVAYVAREGYNPEFGARPMQRLIQEKIEQVIADKIIKGEIHRGETVELSSAELAR